MTLLFLGFVGGSLFGVAVMCLLAFCRDVPPTPPAVWHTHRPDDSNVLP